MFAQGQKTYATLFGLNADMRATEAFKQAAVARAQSYSQFVVTIATTAATAAAAFTVTLRKNGVAAITVNVPIGTGGVNVNTTFIQAGTCILQQGDLVSVEIDDTAGATTGVFSINWTVA